jgi:RNA-directed DNA polymerase
MSDEKLAGSREVRRWQLHRRTNDTLDDLAEAINPIVRGWMNYRATTARAGCIRS